MSTLTHPETVSGAATVRRMLKPAPQPIPFSRIVGVELRKMFDTRSGFWMLASVGITAVLATGAVVVFAPDSELTFEAFASAIGIPMAVILPMIAILSVSSEWSQRTGLTTFALVPHRGRVITAKAACALLVGVASMLVAFVVGALGNIVGTAIAGVDTTWGVSATEFAMIILAQVLGMMVGFMLGVLLRNSAGAIVGYFVYSFVLPTLSMLLASAQGWFADAQPWVDFNYATTPLFDGLPTATEWAQLGVSGFFWLVLPLAIGVRLVLRSEVK